LCTVARLLTSIQKRANQSFALGMYALNSKSWAKSVVSNFRRLFRVASPRTFARARVCILPAPQSQSPKLETTRSLARTSNNWYPKIAGWKQNGIELWSCSTTVATSPNLWFKSDDVSNLLARWQRICFVTTQSSDCQHWKFSYLKACS